MEKNNSNYYYQKMPNEDIFVDVIKRQVLQKLLLPAGSVTPIILAEPLKNIGEYHLRLFTSRLPIKFLILF